MKRHTKIEIEAKLQEAHALAAQGRSNTAIARALNVSVMTLHRWRKASAPRHGIDPLDRRGDIGRRGPAEEPPMPALRLENERLRRLVTDLLLKLGELEGRFR
jgi:transposase